MKKQLKDYLHLYLECEVYTKDFDGVDDYTFINLLTLVDLECGKYDEFKPILRQLNSITEEEAKDIVVIYFGVNGYQDYLAEDMTFLSFLNSDIEVYTERIKIDIGNPEVWKYLLSKHFDLFNLIEEGLAIDATTL